MPTFRQLAAFTGVGLPLLVASALVIGGFQNRGASYVLLAVCVLWAIGLALFVPIRSMVYQRMGFAPFRATHKVIGGGAVLQMDLGTEPSIQDLYCEVHIPQYHFVGGKPSGTAKRPALLGSPDRTTTFMFPDDFGLAPIFKQARCVGWYRVHWVITQHDQKIVKRDRFHIQHDRRLRTFIPRRRSPDR
jgi:hypothetical protein